MKRIGTTFTEEQLNDLQIGDGYLNNTEVDMFKKLVKEYECCFAYDESEIGRIKMSPVSIRLVDHIPWSKKPIPLPKSLRNEVLEFIRTKLDRGLFEPCHGPYQNQWFVIIKPNGKFRLIHNLQPANENTIREIGSPPDVDSMTEQACGSSLYAILDGTGGYSQMPLDDKSRDCTAIETPLGLLRSTVAIQGATNSVAQYQRQMTRMFSPLMPDFGLVYLDDLILKNNMLQNGDMKIDENGIREDVRVLYDKVKMAFDIAKDYNYTFSPQKLRLGVRKVEVLGFECHGQGRTLTENHLNRIEKWPVPKNVDDVRSFVQMCNFFRVLIKDFAGLTAPLYELLKKDTRFEWNNLSENCFKKLIKALASRPVVAPPDFSLPFIINCDAGPDAGGGYMGQEVIQEDGSVIRVIVKYVSFKFSDRQKKYAQVKRELLTIMEMIKKLKEYIYGKPFYIETDCKPAIQMIHKLDLIDPTLTRWVTFIALFGPIMIHVPGRNMVVSDAISRSLNEFYDEIRDEDPVDYVVRSVRVDGEAELDFDETEYDQEFRAIGRHLCFGVFESGLNSNEKRKLIRRCTKYCIRNGKIYRKPKSVLGMPKRVVCDKEDQQRIMESCHDELGHKGMIATSLFVKNRYYWKNIDSDVKEFIRSCHECQIFARKRYDEPMNVPDILTIQSKWYVDIQFLPKSKGYVGIIEAREALSGWVEARMVKDKTAEVWASFIFEALFSRYGCVRQVVTDNGELNSEIGRLIFERYNVKVIFTTAYHPQGNGVVERGHVPIADTLRKMAVAKPKRWVKYFYAAIWADRVTIRRSGYSAYQLMYGLDCVFPVEMEFGTWWLHCDADITTEELLVVRTRQLAKLDDDRELAKRKIAELRGKDKLRFDTLRKERPLPIEEGDLVLLHNSALVKGKLDPNWFGPYKVVKVYENGTYLLAELDGTRMAKPVAGNRVKEYFSREGNLQLHWLQLSGLGVNVVRNIEISKYE